MSTKNKKDDQEALEKKSTILNDGDRKCLKKYRSIDMGVRNKSLILEPIDMDVPDDSLILEPIDMDVSDDSLILKPISMDVPDDIPTEANNSKTQNNKTI